MAQVTITINGRKYQIACDEGQEAHLIRLGDYVDKRVGELVAAVGQVGDSQILVMAGLLIADELSDIYAELESLKSADHGVAARIKAEAALGSGINNLAQRIEDIAESLEQS
ncbi:MAG: cell division protein ZapA [Rhodospirillales bacterium]